LTLLPPRRDLTLSWVTDPADLGPLREDWQALAERVRADVYMRPDWLEVWWPHFGAGRRLACLVARAGGVLVGVLPFALERIWLGPWPLRIARLAGTDPHCVVFQLPLEPPWAAEVLLAATRHLTGALRCSVVSFTPVSDLATHLAPLQSLSAAGTRLAVLDEPDGRHVVFDLPGAFEDYLDRLTKKRRGQFRRDLRGLEDQFGMTSDHLIPDAAAFADFVTFHSRQWQAAGRGGHFVDWPGSAAFYGDLATNTASHDLLRLYRLNGTAGPIATQFALIAGQTAHWRLPARSLDPAAERLSAGKAGLLLMIEQLIGAGITRIEAGRGEYGYKLDYGGQSVPVHRLIVRSDTGKAALKIKMLLGWADLLNFVYYRLWFLKLAPRVQAGTGRKPRPLWRSWIRMRL
jgi:CelD/BcsL family acetyltransferase involved in cellulose biosynthesis